MWYYTIYNKKQSICSATADYDKNCAIIKQKFLYTQNKDEILEGQIK